MLKRIRDFLTRIHYRLLIEIDDKMRFNFYLTECAEQKWSTCQLERQINSFYYERLLIEMDIRKDEGE